MTRAEAIKCIQEDGIRLGAGDFVDVEALKVAVECMQEQERSKWISVADKLPEHENAVLCVTKNGNPFIGRYDHKWNHWRVSGSVTVTHWMPLPEPPKEDNNNGQT